jgi:hypothetical protein
MGEFFRLCWGGKVISLYLGGGYEGSWSGVGRMGLWLLELIWRMSVSGVGI